MKKFFMLAAALFAATALQAQPQLAGIDKIYVYGVDFSVAKVNAAAETDTQFASAFEGINDLFLSQPDKYDCGKAFHKIVAGVDIAPTQQNNKTRDFAVMRTDPMQLATENTVQELVKNYELPQTEGTGVVIAALLLNKKSNAATFEVVFFDIATREIILSREVTAKAGGFGLRNFWARSVFEVLKNWKTK